MFEFDKDIILENARVRLEPMKFNHRDMLREIALVEVNLLTYSPSEINTEGKLHTYFDSALQAKKDRWRYPFVIYDKQFSKWAGSTSFANVSNENQRIEIGWTWIGRNFQRTGLNRHCKYLLLSYAFDQLGFKRVELKTDGRNVQSRTAIESIGARYEGTLRSHTVMYNGYRRDTVYYSILGSEWPAVRTQRFKGIT